ncbi:MAG TPA: ABC transporter permease, partial [Desulfobacteraceae bacterium]|nr:ABC transporter permease [Desulfobacteraceae bacterium]
MINNFIGFFQLVWHRRRLIFSMAAREVKSLYVGSSLGLLWTVINPVV